MAKSRSSRKRQTTLALTPLPSSSPASSLYNPQIRDRAAAVRYGDSPSPAKRRRIEEPVSSSHVNVGMFPTPDSSLTGPPNPRGDGFGTTEVAPVRSSKASRKRKRLNQQMLDFEKSTGTRASPSQSTAPKATRHEANFFRSQKTLAGKQPGNGSDSESEDQRDAPTNGSRRKASGKSTFEVAVSGRRMRQSKRGSSPAANDAGIQNKPSAAVVDLGQENSDDDSDDMPTTPATRRQGRRSQPISSPVTGDSDSDVLPQRPLRSTQKQELSKDDDEDDDEDVPLQSSHRRKRLKRVIDVDESGSEVESASDRTSRSPAKLSREERQEIQDDLRDLESSGDEGMSHRKVSKNDLHLSALEKLKQRRAGQLATSASSNSDNGLVEDSSDVETVDVPQHQTTARDMFREDEDDDDFLIDEDEDEDDTLGVPTGVPLAFTRYASMKAKALFKFAVEWMVQKKINPAFQIDDEIYVLTFKKLDDEVKGLASSKFMSAAWTQDFSFALRARPQIAYTRIDGGIDLLRDKCDACNRSGHPATYQIQFQGRPYHRQTLEEIASPDDDDESDSDADSDSETVGGTRDAEGRVIPTESTIFYVGNFCKSNAENAHALQHWRFHLYEWVVEWLESAGHNTPEKIVRRDKWSVRKRRKDANKIVDEMERQGKIKALYDDFKAEISHARETKMGRWDA